MAAVVLGDLLRYRSNERCADESADGCEGESFANAGLAAADACNESSYAHGDEEGAVVVIVVVIDGWAMRVAAVDRGDGGGGVDDAVRCAVEVVGYAGEGVEVDPY